MLLISKYSVSKQGYVQKEQKIALEILDEFPSDEIFVIPVRLDNTELRDEKIRNLQCADLSVYVNGFNKILKSMSIKTIEQYNIKTDSTEKNEAHKETMDEIESANTSSINIKADRSTVAINSVIDQSRRFIFNLAGGRK